MAKRVVVQDGKVLYQSSDPGSLDMDFSVSGVVNVSNQVNVGDNPLSPGIISTPPGSGVDLTIKTYNNGIDFGNIKLDSITDGGNILLNNISWPDGTVSPVPGMYIGVSALNTLQFLTLPIITIPPKYEYFAATSGQVVFNTILSTLANSGGNAYLQVFVNGIKQIEGFSKAYQVTGLNQITFNVGLTLSDDIEIYAFL